MSRGRNRWRVHVLFPVFCRSRWASEGSTYTNIGVETATLPGRSAHVIYQLREAARRSLSLHRTQMAQRIPGGRDSVEPSWSSPTHVTEVLRAHRVFGLTTDGVSSTIVQMKIVADTNTFLAVALNEPERTQIVRATTGHDLVAPEVLPFEIGNALTAMLKRGALSAEEVPLAWDAVQAIPVDLRGLDLPAALALAVRFGVYAYDAYFLECALSLRLPLLTLDPGMKHIARQLSISIVE
mgnify:CR=1 FL=1|jgi:predicted nucleic acid-binding protein